LAFFDVSVFYLLQLLTIFLFFAFLLFLFLILLQLLTNFFFFVSFSLLPTSHVLAISNGHKTSSSW